MVIQMAIHRMDLPLVLPPRIRATISGLQILGIHALGPHMLPNLIMLMAAYRAVLTLDLLLRTLVSTFGLLILMRMLWPMEILLRSLLTLIQTATHRSD